MRSKTKIVIVGVKAKQQGRVDVDNCKLVFIDPKKGIGRKFPKADLYVIWTRFVNHTICNAIYSQVSKDQIIWHENGGVGGLVDLVKAAAA